MTDNEREKCQGCGVAIGGVEEHFLTDYRGHRICSWCSRQWAKMERMRERELSFEEFMNAPIRIPGKAGQFARQEE